MINAQFFAIMNYVFWGLIIIGFIVFAYRIKYIRLAFKKDKKLPNAEEKKSFCVLIAARNESRVIGRCLKSIKEQNYPAEKLDIYVIVESEEDKTVEITHEYGYNVFVRKDLTKVGKGYALDECIQDIFVSHKDYDLLSIVDADNVLAKNFFEEMNNAYALGYQMGTGYRREYNKQGNWVADCSELTFAGVNTFQNKARTILNRNIIVSGTGLYLDFELIKKLGGWPFNTLTEDYEMSVWCCHNDIKTAYIPTTYYYDEQPTTLRVSRKQRVRWIRGFFQVRKKCGKELRKDIFSKTNRKSKLDFYLGVVPNVIFIATIMVYELLNLGLLIGMLIAKNTLWYLALIDFAGILLLTYIVLQIYTLLQLKAEKRQLKYNKKTAIKIFFLNPFYITLYIPYAIEAIVRKNVGWAPIKHGEADSTSEMTKVEENKDKN